MSGELLRTWRHPLQCVITFKECRVRLNQKDHEKARQRPPTTIQAGAAVERRQPACLRLTCPQANQRLTARKISNGMANFIRDVGRKASERDLLRHGAHGNHGFFGPQHLLAEIRWTGNDFYWKGLSDCNSSLPIACTVVAWRVRHVRPSCQISPMDQIWYKTQVA